MFQTWVGYFEWDEMEQHLSVERPGLTFIRRGSTMRQIPQIAKSQGFFFELLRTH